MGNDKPSWRGEFEIRLPTEWEWQWAAQGPDGRAYPWGKDFDAGRCNTTESGIGMTTPVGSYAQGASPYGVLDMAGNVWEWCLNEQDKPTDTGLAGSAGRVVRGGSWGYYRRSARCASRDWDDPADRVNLIGFRVIVAPPISQSR